MPAFIQSAASSSATTATPNVAFPANVTAGNAIIVHVTWQTASGSVTSVTDAQGNTYTSMGTRVQAVNTSELWAAFNVVGGSTNTVTAHISASQAGAVVGVYEVSGLSGTQDGYSTGSGTASLLANSGNITTTTANDFVIGFYRGGGLANAEPGWTNVGSAEYKTIAPIGTYKATFALTSSSSWVALVAAFKPNPPSVSVQSATSITSNSATLNGTIVSTAAGNCVIAGFNFGLTTSYGATVQNTGSFSAGTFSVPVTGLQPSTTYHVQAFAENVGASGFSSDTTFTTSAGAGPPTPPTYTNGEVRFNGTQLGTSGQDVTGTKANLTDADNSTVWTTTATDNFDWAGIDCGVATNLTRVRISPQGGQEDACVRMQIQGSNDVTFATGAAVLYTIASTPTPGILLQEYAISIPFGWTFRYYRLWCNYTQMRLADLDFIGNYTSGVTAACVKPDMTPIGGVYDKPVRVRLSCITTGTSIYYVTDGSTPTTGSTLYTGPFALSTDGAIVRSISTATGLSNSRVAFTASPYCNSDNNTPGLFHFSNDIVPGKNRYDSNRGYRLTLSEGCMFEDPVSGWWYEYGREPEIIGASSSSVWNQGSAIYKSADLRNWQYAGNICSPDAPGMANAGDSQQRGCTPIFHRIQVLYNAANNNYVAWTADYTGLSGIRYHRVWTSSSPEGPFTLITTFTGGLGGRSGTGFDIGSFVDPTNGQAYFMWVNQGAGALSCISVAKLNAAYTDVQTGASNMYTIDFGATQANWRESPTMGYRNGTYFLMMSGQTGIGYNTNYYVTASSALGPWNGTQTNPFQTSTHEDNTKAYRTQSIQIIKIPGRDDGTGKGAYVYMGVRNYSEQTPATDYNTDMVLLPIAFPTDTTMTISWDPYTSGWSLDTVFPTVSGAPSAAT